jgi:hypothetical protein
MRKYGSLIKIIGIFLRLLLVFGNLKLRVLPLGQRNQKVKEISDQSQKSAHYAIIYAICFSYQKSRKIFIS